MMKILNGTTPSACQTRSRKHSCPTSEENLKPEHGSKKFSLFPMDAVHVTHDVAMIGMNLPGVGHGHHGHHGHHAMLSGSMCGSSAPPEPGRFDAFTQGGTVHQGLTLMSAYAAAGATYHGVKMLSHGHYAHGANHLLMGAGSGVMAAAMATGSHGLHSASSVLMGAHGAAEVALGVQGFTKAQTPKQKALALTTAVHGACLAAAQLTNNASITIPLYLGMGAATLAQVALKH